MHEAAARAHGAACEYRRFDLEALGVDVDGLPDIVTMLERQGYAGFNVTHPCKQAVLQLLTDLSDDARDLGAVNTVVLRSGRRYGHNRARARRLRHVRRFLRAQAATGSATDRCE